MISSPYALCLELPWDGRSPHQGLKRSETFLQFVGCCGICRVCHDVSLNVLEAFVHPRWWACGVAAMFLLRSALCCKRRIKENLDVSRQYRHAYFGAKVWLPGTMHRGSVGVLCSSGLAKPQNFSKATCFQLLMIKRPLREPVNCSAQDLVFLGGLFYMWHSTVSIQADSTCSFILVGQVQGVLLCKQRL